MAEEAAWEVSTSSKSTRLFLSDVLFEQIEATLMR
jgi:hypothetical protein